MAMTVAGCGKDSNIYDEDGNVSLRMAQTSAADGAIGISMETFAENVKEKSEGRIEISVSTMDSLAQREIISRRVSLEIWILRW